MHLTSLLESLLYLYSIPTILGRGFEPQLGIKYSFIREMDLWCRVWLVCAQLHLQNAAKTTQITMQLILFFLSDAEHLIFITDEKLNQREKQNDRYRIKTTRLV